MQYYYKKTFLKLHNKQQHKLTIQCNLTTSFFTNTITAKYHVS